MKELVERGLPAGYGSYLLCPTYRF